MPRRHAVRRAPKRLTVMGLVGALAMTGLMTFPIAPAQAADYPGENEIAAAQAAAADAAASVSQLDAAIAQLEDALHQADVAARLADEDYHIAQDAAVAAERNLYAANNRADEADAALAEAKTGLAAVAMASYRNAGSMGSVEAIVKSDGFDEVVTRTEGINRASADADSTVQKVQAAEIVADTTREYAEQAAIDSEKAAEEAEEALDTAKAARASAEQAVGDAATARAAATERLAEMRGVTAELEQERQNGLAAERAARQQAQFQEEQERAQQASAPSRGSSNSGGSSSGGSSSGGSSGSGGQQADNPTNPNPRPTQTSDPVETSEPAPEQTSDPAPKPKPEPEPEPSNSWRSSASQGSTAAAHSLTLKGAPYGWGQSGPAYDCSGLTSASWAKAGISIPRSSGQQYNGMTLLPYSELRKGDLIFWGAGRSSSAIYHVAMYVGGGMIMEAQTKGTTAQSRGMYSWAVGDMMPYIGRP
ncbi:NlpC/P60 family protein [Demequina sp. SO4-13]|uniref:C40 family peptidase n=1 Tax=Demequina sp. SO4-13 TaxID=3401027 RepID=UPI003AF5851D